MGLLVTMAVIVALAVLAWMILLPRVVRTGIEQATGLPTRIDRLTANPFTGTFHAEGLRFGQPEGWGGGVLAEVPTCSGKIKLTSLTQTILIVETLSVDLARLVLIVDESGRVNVESIAHHPPASHRNPVRWAGALATGGAGATGSSHSLPQDLLVQQLDLKIGLIELEDRSLTPTLQVSDDLAFQQRYTDIHDPRQLLSSELVTRLAGSPALLKVLLAKGMAIDGETGQPAWQKLWQDASGTVNSFLQGLEQKPKP
jgi:hypothetical protein